MLHAHAPADISGGTTEQLEARLKRQDDRLFHVGGIRPDITRRSALRRPFVTCCGEPGIGGSSAVGRWRLRHDVLHPLCFLAKAAAGDEDGRSADGVSSNECERRCVIGWRKPKPVVPSGPTDILVFVFPKSSLPPNDMPLIALLVVARLSLLLLWCLGVLRDARRELLLLLPDLLSPRLDVAMMASPATHRAIFFFASRICSAVPEMYTSRRRWFFCMSDVCCSTTKAPVSARMRFTTDPLTPMTAPTLASGMLIEVFFTSSLAAVGE